jgi:hypothetical protein
MWIWMGVEKVNSKLYNLPKEMQDEVLKLAAEHSITIDEAYKYYLMGGENADYLCYLKDAGCPEGFIELQNQSYWTKKNKELWKELADSDFVKGRKLTNSESNSLMFQDITFDSEEFERVTEQYVKLK